MSRGGGLWVALSELAPLAEEPFRGRGAAEHTGRRGGHVIDMAAPERGEGVRGEGRREPVRGEGLREGREQALGEKGLSPDEVLHVWALKPHVVEGLHLALAEGAGWGVHLVCREEELARPDAAPQDDPEQPRVHRREARKEGSVGLDPHACQSLEAVAGLGQRRHLGREVGGQRPVLDELDGVCEEAGGAVVVVVDGEGVIDPGPGLVQGVEGEVNGARRSPLWQPLADPAGRAPALGGRVVAKDLESDGLELRVDAKHAA